MTVILIVNVLGVAETGSEQSCRAYWISKIRGASLGLFPRGGPECDEPLGCDSDESDASRSAVSSDGTSKVS